MNSATFRNALRFMLLNEVNGLAFLDKDGVNYRIQMRERITEAIKDKTNPNLYNNIEYVVVGVIQYGDYDTDSEIVMLHARYDELIGVDYE